MIYISKYIINASVLINMHDMTSIMYIYNYCAMLCKCAWKTKYFWFSVAENNKIVSAYM